MRLKSCLILGSLAVLCAGNATAKDRKTPELDPKLGAIGVSIKLKGPTALSVSSRATAAFFVRSGDSTDFIHAADYLVSNFEDDDQVYLLNVEPGRYVVIGAYAPRSEGAPNSPGLPSSNTYFDEAMIRATEVTVEAGHIAFMGEIVVKTSTGMKNADAAQNHFGDLIGRGMSANVGAGVAVAQGSRPAYSLSIGVGHVTRAGALKSMEREPATERKFWTKAIKKVFNNEPDWLQLAQARVDALP